MPKKRRASKDKGLRNSFIVISVMLVIFGVLVPYHGRNFLDRGGRFSKNIRQGVTYEMKQGFPFIYKRDRIIAGAGVYIEIELIKSKAPINVLALVADFLVVLGLPALLYFYAERRFANTRH